MRFQGLCKVFEHELELFRSVTRWYTLTYMYIRKHTCQKMHTALCSVHSVQNDVSTTVIKQSEYIYKELFICQFVPAQNKRFIAF
jgi:hypothetical protein